MEKDRRSQYATIEVALFDNTKQTCLSCSAFGKPYIYCPVFNFIMSDENVRFDETGEKNGCEFFKNIIATVKRKEFEAASRPLMEWLSKNCHPHVTVIVDSSRSEMLEGVVNFPTDDYI